MENKFKKGLILGGLLVAGVAFGFAVSKEGQELSEEAQKYLKTLAKKLKKNLHKLEDVTKESFDDLVTTIVDEYVKEKELANNIQKELVTALQAMWQEMEAEYQAEKEEITKE